MIDFSKEDPYHKDKETSFPKLHPKDIPESDQNAYLLFRAQKGLKEKGLFDQPNYQQRLMYEWETICKMNFSGYFLVVSDYVCWAKNQGIPVGPGRGSGGGSLVAYAIGIIDVDPIKCGLYFERRRLRSLN